MKPILECKGLSKKYNKSAYALHNLNLTLNHGQIVGLLGPNGSGKTTLIKLINDLLTPTEGTVLIDGELPGVHSKNIVSYLPDHSYLDGSMKIQDLVSYFADFYEDFSKVRATSMLKDLNIDPTARLKTLSKGNQEKVALILVMSRDAKLYILDEPIGGDLRHGDHTRCGLACRPCDRACARRRPRRRLPLEVPRLDGGRWLRKGRAGAHGSRVALA